MNIEKTYRLNKVAAEFNVSWKTIIEHLEKKGFDIEPKITAKVNQSMYDELLKHYQQDKIAKEESKQLDAKIRKEQKAEDVKRPEKKAEPVVEVFQEDTIWIKDTVFKKTYTENPVISEKPPVEIPEEKIVVEIPEEPKPTEDLPLPQVDVEIVTQKIDEVKSESKPAPEESTSELIGPKVIGKIELPKPVVRTRNKKTPDTPPVAEIKQEETKEEKQDLVVPDEKIEATPKEPIVDDVKIVEESTPEREESKEPLVQEIKPIVESDSEEKIETKFQKLDGTKVLGNIEIPKPIKRERRIIEKPEARPKRKRIQNEKVSTDKPTTPKPFDPKSRLRPPSDPKPTVSEKDVQDKIKQTMARMGNQKTTPKQGGKVRQKARKDRRKEHRAKWEEQQLQEQIESKILDVTEFVTANELANLMDVNVNDVIGSCLSLGMMVSINQRLDAETIQIVADEFGFEVNFASAQETIEIEDIQDEEGDLTTRHPIVTVMGHVDHGKTSLLDYIRKANVIAGEAGGITQHVAAYEVKIKGGQRITFIDTPGHEAFTAMRARGAKVTDIAIIVIAADDAIMPQTKEAISHAQAAQVPIVFAFNKIDKPGANVDRIKEQLSAMNILVEEWGGKYQSQEISAKNGINIDELLEKVMLEAEILELKSNPNRRAKGVVLEAKLEKGRGVVTSLIIQTGTLKVGDPLVAGQHYARIKAMFNERGQAVPSAGPSSPISILGFSGTPAAGEVFQVMADESTAKEIANKREQLQREQGIRATKRVTLDEIGKRLAVGNFKELNIILKADVDGSVEALSDSLIKLSTEEIQVNVIHKSVGPISENDVLLATASDAIVIGFQVRPVPGAKKLAENEHVEIRLYSVIYQAIDEIKLAMEGLLDPEYKEEITGTAEIREVFKISKVGSVAGCMITDGKIFRDNQIRLIREGVVIYTGSLDSLKRYKDDAKEVAKGYECGIQIKNYNDIREYDIIEGFTQVEIKRKL